MIAGMIKSAHNSWPALSTHPSRYRAGIKAAVGAWRLRSERLLLRCGSQWDDRQTAPVGLFNANASDLYDMQGNVRTCVEDCDHHSYEGYLANRKPVVAAPVGGLETAAARGAGLKR
jgi:formylglycine-generating enzyme required for sulfatase activity